MDMMNVDAFNISNTYTASTNTHDTVSVQDIIKMMEEANKQIPAINKDWFLVSPHGEAFKGSPQQLINELMKHHPLFKNVFTPIDPL